MVIPRCDIVMDLARPINPTIDVGQIEGAFTQGLGLAILEELNYKSAGGYVFSDWYDYHPPSFADVPREWNVSLMKSEINRRGVLS
eukprot:gene17242-19482_t